VRLLIRQRLFRVYRAASLVEPAGLLCFQADPFFPDERMDFEKFHGLVPAVVQDDTTNEVLMVGFMNDEALAKTRATGYVTFFSRTRNTLWTKGETSGNRLQVVSLLTDCDDDTILARVKRLGDGNVCHTGARTCFFTPLES
jgi:phosphoribosyl-ATP pyrophosphohydrolase/phosphoribosyl-AMP cyclohydrolase